MPFYYHRTVYFAETDAAGVVYFAHLFQFCHEAYEASLAAAGIDLYSFFCQPELGFPIRETQAKFYRPMVCGDQLKIELTPQLRSDHEYHIEYRVLRDDRLVAEARTHHICLDSQQRTRQNLPDSLHYWLHQWS